MSKYNFYAKLQKGNILKGIFNILGRESVETVHIILSPEGFAIKDVNESLTTSLDLFAPYSDFMSFHCDTRMIISFPVKNAKEQLKNAAKKGYIIMYIVSGTEQLTFEIRSESTEVKARCEISSIKFNREPDDWTSIDPPPEQFYHKAMAINSSEFQKIKNMISKEKKCYIFIQNDNYISFKTTEDALLQSENNFGTRNDEEPCYQAVFNSSDIYPLIKLNEVGVLIRFYAPVTTSDFFETGELYPPLRVEIQPIQNSLNFGVLKVYVKDADFIKAENDIKKANEPENVIVNTSAKPNRRGRKPNN